MCACAERLQVQADQFLPSDSQTLLTLGLITIEQRFGEKRDFDVKSFVVREKYVPVRQPIPKRPPDGLNLPRLMWTICKRWNDEFLERKYDS